MKPFARVAYDEPGRPADGVELVVSRGLKSGRLDVFALSPLDALSLADELLRCATNELKRQAFVEREATS